MRFGKRIWTASGALVEGDRCRVFELLNHLHNRITMPINREFTNQSWPISMVFPDPQQWSVLLSSIPAGKGWIPFIRKIFFVQNHSNAKTEDYCPGFVMRRVVVM